LTILGGPFRLGTNPGRLVRMCWRMIVVDWQELNKTRVADLRDMLKEKNPNLQGVMSMKKEDLVEELAGILNIEKPTKTVVGIDKAAIKGKISELKVLRQQALEKGDHAELRVQRRKIHRLKRTLRKAMTS